jgi:hypothetical protein
MGQLVPLRYGSTMRRVNSDLQHLNHYSPEGTGHNGLADASTINEHGMHMVQPSTPRAGARCKLNAVDP